MKKIKKELLKVILVSIIGISIVMLISWNVEQYDKKFPNQKVSSNYEYEITHHN